MNTKTEYNKKNTNLIESLGPFKHWWSVFLLLFIVQLSLSYVYHNSTDHLWNEMNLYDGSGLPEDEISEISQATVQNLSAPLFFWRWTQIEILSILFEMVTLISVSLLVGSLLLEKVKKAYLSLFALIIKFPYILVAIYSIVSMSGYETPIQRLSTEFNILSFYNFFGPVKSLDKWYLFLSNTDMSLFIGALLSGFLFHRQFQTNWLQTAIFTIVPVAVMLGLKYLWLVF
ncbi:hypothetical protein ACMAZF_00545 [Psychrobium sp. nBUS_13]|jgi:hypothetical protein|uniref:hypothetical protein n=1 Tax=Psychrobium sp. nBUS_13 TaxID=3395319 RepID=UPI003EBC6208